MTNFLGISQNKPRGRNFGKFSEEIGSGVGSVQTYEDNWAVI